VTAKTIFQSFLLLTSTKQVETQNQCLRLEARADAEATQASAGQMHSGSGLLPSHVSALLCASRSPTNAICYKACCYADAPLRWWIRAVESIWSWLPEKSNVSPLPSPKPALESHVLNTAASDRRTPPLAEAFGFTQNIFLSLGNVGQKTVLTITVNCTNWDI